jgi:hypothetical protein
MILSMMSARKRSSPVNTYPFDVASRSSAMARKIVARQNGVLHEPLRHPADGAGAEADQRVGGIVGVALEVALQPAVLSCDGQAVAREGEMI